MPNVTAFSPLTDGQEAMMLSGETNIGVVFGPPIGSISRIEATLKAPKRVLHSIAAVEGREIEARFLATKRDLLDAIKRVAKGSRQHVLVVSSNSPWRPDWVLEAERLEKVRKRTVRLVFVGSPDHAREWAADPAVRRRTMPQVRIVKLRPWTRSFLGSQIESLQLKPDLVDRILQETGGWNEVVGPLMEKFAEKPEHASVLIADAHVKALAVPGLTTDLGIPDDLLDFFRMLAAFAKEARITTADFQEACTWEGRKLDPKIIGAYGDLMGLLSFPPDEGPEHTHSKVDFNALALAALTKGS